MRWEFLYTKEDEALKESNVAVYPVLPWVAILQSGAYKIFTASTGGGFWIASNFFALMIHVKRSLHWDAFNALVINEVFFPGARVVAFEHWVGMQCFDHCLHSNLFIRSQFLLLLVRL